MTYEVKTPSLAKVESAMLGVMDGAINGTIDTDDGKLACNAANQVTKAVATDIKARVSAAEIARSEDTAQKILTQEQNSSIAA